MKFTYEKLEEISEGMNALYEKCSNIICHINTYIKKQEKKLIEDRVIDRWAFKHVFISNPFDEEFVNLFSDDGYIYFDGRAVGVFGSTPEFNDGLMTSSKFEIPFEWLELGDEELNSVLNDFAQSKIDSKLMAIKEREEKMKQAELEKARELLSKFTKDELGLI